MQRRLIASLILTLTVALLLAGRPAHAQDGGWTIERFHAEYTVQPDASFTVTEAIDVDFGGLQRHGIFREIPVRYSYNKEYERVYGLDVISVTKADGSPWPYTREQSGANVRLKIGDPDRFVSGRQTYRISYRVRDALNAFSDHDELYWNVNGFDWPVPTLATSATVRLADGLERGTCFQGSRDSTDPCRMTESLPDAISYEATTSFQPGQQLTIVSAVRKGAIAEPKVDIEKKPRDPSRFFEVVNPVTVGGSVVLLLGGFVLLAQNWWRRGRDRQYTTLYYLTENPEEETKPLFSEQPIVIEYQPPEQLKPAQMGLLLDERADTKDVTATIVDLAVRGYLTITEIPKKGIFGSKDWTLTRTKAADNGLERYERLIFEGLFADGSEVKLSDLKNEYYKQLQEAQKALYQTATSQGWFVRGPDSARSFWRGVAVGLVVLGAALTVALGFFFGMALLGVPVVVVGVILLLTARAMPKRTAQGSELLRRTLGFRRYITTAETDRQRFNEQTNIFAEYLPYAIVFGAVDKWARAFRDIDVQPQTAGWYVGAAAFDARGFSRDLESFSSNVSNVITSTPGSSGGSGFSGGSSGGGGGGGGGGSW